MKMLEHLFGAVTVGGEPVKIPAENKASFSSQVGGLKIEYIQEFPTEDSVYRRFVLTNVGTVKTPQLTDLYVCRAEIPCGETVRFNSLRGDDNSKESFLPTHKLLKTGDTLTLEPTGGRSSNTTAFPFFDFDLGGKAIYFSVGWSGQWKCEIEKKENLLTVKIGHAYADFYLEPGESVSLPSVFSVEGESGESVRKRAKKIMRNHFDPLQGTGITLPISSQPYDRYFYGRCPEWPTEEGQIRLLHRAEKCKYFNTHWLDAAWFKEGFPNGVGNYSFEKGFPRGLKKVSDAVHEAGMRFLLWFEPERIVKGSEVETEHPEFLLSVPNDEFTYCYNLGKEDAYCWLRDTLVRFIGENGLDIYRQDFNFEPLPYWRNNDEENRAGMVEIRYINGLYRLWDDLKKAYPKLVIDDCASGGRRIDFETMRRAVPLWRSDVACGPITETAHNDVYDQNQTLCLGEYLPYHSIAAWELVANDIRSAATEGLACTFDFLNPDFDFELATALLEEVTRLAKDWDGDFYPLSEPTLREDVSVAYQLAKQDHGFAVIFRRADCPECAYPLFLKSIDIHADYRLTVSDEHLDQTVYDISGADLVNGFTVPLPQPHTSAVVEYRIR